MELEKNNHYAAKQKPISVLKDDGFSAGRILARETSVGQSSHIFYRAAEGVPFKWEMQPGTPRNNPQEEIILPPSPSPLMQNFGLSLPNLDHEEEEPSKGKIWSLKKFLKKTIGRSSNKAQDQSSRFGDNFDVTSSVNKDSSFSSYSSSLSLSPDPRIVDGPFCCSPWNISSILDEGNTRIYYCRQHKTIFAGDDVSFLGNISSVDQFTPGVNKLVMPPSPRPTIHQSSKDSNTSKLKGAWLWIRSKYKTRKNKRLHKDDDKEFDASFRKSCSVSSSSSVSPLSKSSWRMSKIKKSLNDNGHFSCGPWSRREILVFATRKFKSFAF